MTLLPLVVALDGPASSGKSSVGAAAAREVGFRFCDTGLLYRAITWLVLQRGIDPADAPALVGLVGEVELAADPYGRLARVLVDGQDVTELVHAPDVDRRVSEVSRVAELRAALLQRQRSIASGGRIVVAGRDIGTVVLPHAGLKVFLDASAEERARRRAEERGLDPNGGEAAAVLAELRRRDDLDRNRPVAPLRPALDAIHIVTDGNTFEQTVAAVVAAIHGAGDVPARAAATAAPADGGSGLMAETDTGSMRSDANWFIRDGAFIARTITRSLTRVKVSGALDAIPRSGPLIIASNHASNADGVIVGAWLIPRLGRRIHWLGKREMTRWPIVGPIVLAGSVHPVDRANVDIDVFRLLLRILEAGNVVVVFPEGTRSATGEMQAAKDGVAMLALRSDAQILPVGVVDTDRFWPKGKLPRLGGHVELRVGEPFKLSEALPPGLDRRAAKGAATELIMRRIATLLPARQQGVYASAPASVEAAADQAAGADPGVSAPRVR